MVVGDDGIRLPQNFDFKNTDTLGLQLVSSLVSQLNGEIELNGSSMNNKVELGETGAEYNIIFKSIYE